MLYTYAEHGKVTIYKRSNLTYVGHAAQPDENQCSWLRVKKTNVSFALIDNAYGTPAGRFHCEKLKRPSVHLSMLVRFKQTNEQDNKVGMKTRWKLNAISVAFLPTQNTSC